MKFAYYLRLAILIGLTLFQIAPAEEIPIPGTIPFDIQEIDITYSETGPPRLSFRFTPPPRPVLPPFRPSTPQFDLLSIIKTANPTEFCETSSAGTARNWTIMFRGAGARRCEAVMNVQGSTAIDVLSYATLAIKGHTAQPVTIALANGPDQPMVPLAQVTRHFDLRLALKPIISRLDPTRVTRIVFEADADNTTLALEHFSLQRIGASSAPRSAKGFWIWDYRSAVTNPDALIQQCRRAGVMRILVQMPHGDDPDTLWSAYAGLLERATESGLETVALDGYPEAIYDPAPLVSKIFRLRRLLPDGRLTGLQLDIEPYLLAQFSDPQDYSLYLQAIDQIKATLGGRTRLSMVMPFWFSAKTVRNRPLDFEVMDRADEVAVMSYRTDLDDLQDITEHTLRYGDAVGVPVWLAVETRPLPVDRQVTLIRESRPNVANAYLDRAGRRLLLTPPPPDQPEGFRLSHQIMIRPDRLTFAGKTRQEVHAALAGILAFPHSSLAGVLIHDMPGYFSLAE